MIVMISTITGALTNNNYRGMLLMHVSIAVLGQQYLV
jgi:hypothetical protein